jgi:hypothetical protein
MAPGETGSMAGHGEYDHHSLAQHTAGGFGLPLWERAIGDVQALVARDRPVTVADLGAAGGRNELPPMRAAVDGLRTAGVDAPIVVVHTDIPTNDFTTLFETIEHDPNTYLGAPDVFTFAAGRSFYERIFPASSVLLAWSAIAVHWLSRVPVPIPDHVYCEFASGARAPRSRTSRRTTGTRSSALGRWSFTQAARWWWSVVPRPTTARAARGT